MTNDTIYLIGCMAITMAAYYAAFLFAKKDELLYAIFFFLVASGAFYGAAGIVGQNKGPVETKAQQPVEAPKPAN